MTFIQVIEKYPKDHRGYQALCMNRGRLTEFVENKEKVKLAGLAKEAYEKALQINPEDDLSQHLKGQWHF